MNLTRLYRTLLSFARARVFTPAIITGISRSLGPAVGGANGREFMNLDFIQERGISECAGGLLAFQGGQASVMFVDSLEKIFNHVGDIKSAQLVLLYTGGDNSLSKSTPISSKIFRYSSLSSGVRLHRYSWTANLRPSLSSSITNKNRPNSFERRIGSFSVFSESMVSSISKKNAPLWIDDNVFEGGNKCNQKRLKVSMRRRGDGGGGL